MDLSSGSKEYRAFFVNGWLVLFIYLLAFAAGWLFVFLFVFSSALLAGALAILIVALPLIGLHGFVILQPNIATVLTFFGSYAGSIKTPGFFWCNPLCARRKISLRVHNFDTAKLKVNDQSGNPVEVAAVIAWRVRDTARATFDVSDFDSFVAIQSESALRQVVSTRHYDGDEQGANSLRGDLEAVSSLLRESIQKHVELAGIEVIEAKIAHLAYAPEIASAMLRRQQAAAVVAARVQIVHGAVSMVQMALEELARGNTVSFNDRDRVQLVTNLMTVLVSDSEAQPVLPMSHAEGGKP
ncbi:MAG: SPFH domain-containing protein [Candidatus Accumulibacter sp.]|jgi:regulator of protease activity HflC (stomatin/prohibitin superfamily)|nr:SPFH domain-containing protein [Accumulibacter sp.]